MSSNFARRSATNENSSQSRLNIAASAYSRDRVHTGRVENLRSMGAELMRPASQEGSRSNQGIKSSGVYQPPTSKYSCLNDYNRGPSEEYQHSHQQQQRQHTEEAVNGAYDRQPGYSVTSNAANLPDASEIQNRLKIASRYSQEKSSPRNDTSKR